VLLPSGEAAKRLSVIEAAADELARLRLERTEPLVALGGGALGDAAGFLAATWLRGVPLIHVPTTLVAQLDSSIGGKTAVDLVSGKNLLGAFHQPAAILIDVDLLAGLPERQRRAALGEAVKMAALGDEALFDLLERDGQGIVLAHPAVIAHGALAELVERCAWAKIEIVEADEHEAAGRVALNLGHSLGHGFEAAAGYDERLLHGEAVAYGLRAACRIGLELGITPADRASRIEGLLTHLGLAPAGGLAALGLDRAAVLDALAADKKHADGRLRWVLPSAGGVEIRNDVPPELVAQVMDELLAAAPSLAGSVGR
ncbi:MAG TPA: 3-dehydroquinate synthase family protein, partial [Candidatus Limnocylindrales bacterium]